MQLPGIIIEDLPPLRNPVMIAGFGGWGNALNVSKAMAAYLIRSLDAVAFARLDPDAYYRYDEHRPVVTIEDGRFRKVVPPGGTFFAARTRSDQRDVIILEADEPDLNWYSFADALMGLCRQLNARLLITIGSMYDNVLHTDRFISGIASDPDCAAILNKKQMNLISYQGPSAIHSVLLAEACKRRIGNISLWCHCPYYLQGTTHFGQLLQLGALLGELGNFSVNLDELEKGWRKLQQQIDSLIGENSELQQLVADLRKRKARGSIASVRKGLKSDNKVIDLKDFFNFSV